jgi:MoxR-like ATPase
VNPTETTDGLGETVTLGQAKALVRAMAHEQSLLLLSPPGIGKSESVAQAAAEAGLPCRSLLGTQIAPEDVSGIPRIVGERAVFCPPRILLPEAPEPFCLFLDELPACAPDVQKAFYSLLLERRLGEHALPPGTWVVAAGNRTQDRALVRAMSSALVNRVVVLDVRVDVREWLGWARGRALRSEVVSFIGFMPEALMRPVPAEPVPFSTPRAWASLARTLDLAAAAGVLDRATRRALAFGRVSAPDAAIFCAMAEEAIEELRPLAEYIVAPDTLPTEPAARWFVLCRIRELVRRRALHEQLAGRGGPRELRRQVNRFLECLSLELRFALLVDLVDRWAEAGADEVLLDSLREVTGFDGPR